MRISINEALYLPAGNTYVNNKRYVMAASKANPSFKAAPTISILTTRLLMKMQKKEEAASKIAAHRHDINKVLRKFPRNTHTENAMMLMALGRLKNSMDKVADEAF